MFVFEPLLQVMHFIQTTIIYVWAISAHLGKGTLFLLTSCFHFCCDFVSGIVLIGEEFFKFLSSLDVITTYIGNSTNSGINGALDFLKIVQHSIVKFFSSVKFQFRATTAKTEIGIKELFNLIRGALILIADVFWWLVTLIPRTIIYIVVACVDFLVLGFSQIVKTILCGIQALLDDVFKLTVGLVVVFLIWRQRRRLWAFFISSIARTKRILRTRWQLLRSRWRPRFAPSTTLRRSPLPNYCRPSLSEAKLLDHQRCVICHDRQKTVLLWPCRHLSLCEECADQMTRLQRYNMCCPLCRGIVEHSISIYT